jgi:hypothetical protein
MVVCMVMLLDSSDLGSILCSGIFFGVLLKTYNASFKYFCVHLLHCQPIWGHFYFYFTTTIEMIPLKFLSPYITYMTIYDINYMYHIPVLYVTTPYKAIR